MTKPKKSNSPPPSKKIVYVHGENTIQQKHPFGMLIVKWLFYIIVALCIVTIAHYIGVSVRNMIRKKSMSVDVSSRRHLVFQQLADIAYYTIISIGVLLAMINLGLQTTTLVTVMGTLLVTAGLALQNILASVASGVSIALSEPFLIGDEIKVVMTPFLKEIVGTVKNFNISYMTIIDKETKSEVYIPNNLVCQNIVNNLSRTKDHPTHTQTPPNSKVF